MEKSCPSCFVGKLKFTRVVHVRPSGRQLMVVPHAPANVCDWCGYTQHDNHFMAQIDLLASGSVDLPADIYNNSAPRLNTNRSRIQSESTDLY